jgi:predicted esterase
MTGSHLREHPSRDNPCAAQPREDLEPVRRGARGFVTREHWLQILASLRAARIERGERPHPMNQEHLIPTTVHGRYLVRAGDPARLLVGFHGYAQTADIQMEEMEQIAGAGEWALVSVQALHPFYNRNQETGACWMTRQNREEAIADNVAYVRKVVETFPKPERLVFTGFSQGAAMAWRAAATNRCDGIIILGGDAPPDVTSELPPALIARGKDDDWYTSEKLSKDLSFLANRCEVTTFEFEGRHEWSAAFRGAAGDFLRMIGSR